MNRRTDIPPWRRAAALLSVMRDYHLGRPLDTESVRLLGGEAEAMKAIEHKLRISDIYQKKRRGETLNAAEAELFLKNEEELRRARQGLTA